ncbi:hypothetical protein Ga0466249_004545 [Sporomusaceae bacterium BoRhaA]|uniref:hypothetical protein n=1 Tax=Pelorhabdus rhamnosifermentans TaxID=2772457 RepID=UPI001C0642D0|nr:hypothetical protein [Pelorhabdus rhamnosifermentans]MBU2703400.1 hypothetical protein [Pelorhabdus rhamnosifermentans]
MEYFRLRQDKDYLNAPIILDVIKQIQRRYVTPEDADKIAEITVFKLANHDKLDSLDLLDRQLFLLSRLLKDTVKLYVPKLVCKKVLLLNSAKKVQLLYYLPIFPGVDCISDQSIMTPDKSVVKKLVLKRAEIPKQAVFKVRHSHETIIIARLDAAESMMRRRFRGIKMHRVELE